jgi:hypothetical protein
MLHVRDGQCGFCAHFGEAHEATKQLNQIRIKHQAPETFVDDCGLLRNADVHLKVTPISSCDGFERAKPS